MYIFLILCATLFQERESKKARERKENTTHQSHERRYLVGLGLGFFFV